MTVEMPSMFAKTIQDHLELKERNAKLEESMPLGHYKTADPFDNHPLFKTEEQARLGNNGRRGVRSDRRASRAGVAG